MAASAFDGTQWPSSLFQKNKSAVKKGKN